jgi:hypothetical protein
VALIDLDAVMSDDSVADRKMHVHATLEARTGRRAGGKTRAFRSEGSLDGTPLTCLQIGRRDSLKMRVSTSQPTAHFFR